MKNFLLGTIALISMNAFAQQNIILNAGDVLSVQCPKGTVLKQLMASTRKSTQTCARACLVTLRTTTTTWGTSYCTVKDYPNQSFNNCSSAGDAKTRDEAIQEGITSAESAVARGACDEIITIGF